MVGNPTPGTGASTVRASGQVRGDIINTKTFPRRVGQHAEDDEVLVLHIVDIGLIGDSKDRASCVTLVERVHVRRRHTFIRWPTIVKLRMSLTVCPIASMSTVITEGCMATVVCEFQSQLAAGGKLEEFAVWWGIVTAIAVEPEVIPSFLPQRLGNSRSIGIIIGLRPITAVHPWTPRANMCVRDMDDRRRSK